MSVRISSMETEIITGEETESEVGHYAAVTVYTLCNLNCTVCLLMIYVCTYMCIAIQ